MSRDYPKTIRENDKNYAVVRFPRFFGAEVTYGSVVNVSLSKYVPNSSVITESRSFYAILSIALVCLTILF